MHSAYIRIMKMIGYVMNANDWVEIAIFILGLVSLLGFFYTKTKGFGRYATSTLLLILVVSLATLLFSAGKLEGHILGNIFFAVIGFAAGLFTNKDASCN